MKKRKNKYSLLNNISFYFKKLYEFQQSTLFIMIGQVVLGVILPVFTIYIPKVLVELVTGQTDVEKFVLLSLIHI